jgi:hypothetical protein
MELRDEERETEGHREEREMKCLCSPQLWLFPLSIKRRTSYTHAYVTHTHRERGIREKLETKRERAKRREQTTVFSASHLWLFPS